MYDSDGGGFFAIGLLMMAAVYGFIKFFMDNIILFFIVMAIFTGGLWFYMKTGIDIRISFAKWWQGHVNRFLIKKFGVSLSDKRIWPVYATLSVIIRLVLTFYAFICSLYVLAFFIEQI